jgi:hypothetical protein
VQREPCAVAMRSGRWQWPAPKAPPAAPPCRPPQGVQLERALGSQGFALLLLELLVLSHGLVAGLAWTLPAYIPAYGYLYYDTCAIGFSAVIFALKVGRWGSGGRACVRLGGLEAMAAGPARAGRRRAGTVCPRAAGACAVAPPAPR